MRTHKSTAAAASAAATHSDSSETIMDSETIIDMAPELWSRLPDEIQDLLLTFLTVPVQCRFRTVCKRWDSLIRTPSFRALSIKHANPHAYILGRVASSGFYGVGILSDNLGWRFLDVKANRWYWIKPEYHNDDDDDDDDNDSDEDQHPDLAPFQIDEENIEYKYEPQSLSMDGGLACAFYAYNTTQLTGIEELTCVISNPVAGVEIARLDDSPYAEDSPGPYYGNQLIYMGIPFLTCMVVEHGETGETRNITLFVMCCAVYESEKAISVVMYDFATRSWRRSASSLAEKIHNPRVIMVRCIVVFRGFLYAVLTNASPCDNDGFWELWRFSPEVDEWTEVASARESVHLRFQVVFPQLVVSDGRLFLVAWMAWSQVITVDVVEILIDAKDWRLVARVSKSEMETAFETDFSERVEGSPGAADAATRRAESWPSWNAHQYQAVPARVFALELALIRWFHSHCVSESPDFAAFGFEKSIVLIARRSGISREIDLEMGSLVADKQPFAQAPLCEHQLWYGQPMNAIIPHVTPSLRASDCARRGSD